MTDRSDGHHAKNDPLLDPLLSATGEEERARAIEALLLDHAAETISRFLRHRTSVASEDLDDIRSTVNLRLVRRLHQSLRDDPIADFAEYVAGITYNAFYDFLRKRHPERMRLKGRIRYVLGHDPRFAMWESQSGIVGGLTAWTGREPRSAAVPLHSIIAPPPSDPQRTGKTLAMVFDRAAGPMPLDDIVSLFMSLWNISDIAQAEPVEQAAPEGSGPHVQYESRQYLGRLWSEVLDLPLLQRVALLLNLRDGDGRNAMGLLLLAGIATPAQAAEALGMTPQQLREIWSKLPMDDLSIGAMLGRSRQQVINLRKAARDRLGRRMNFERRKQ